MEENFVVVEEHALVKAQQEYMSKVYSWMVGGLLITAFTAWFTMSSGFIESIGSMIILLIIIEFGLVIALSGWISKMSTTTASASFLAYSFLNGLTFSVLLLRFSEDAIFTTFSVTACMFAALSLYGFVTKKSLSGVGQFMMMGLVGLIAASILNFFFQSSAMNFIINVIGVIVFAGLTAYDTQKIKEMYSLQYEGSEIATKGAIIGALVLYLDFINLFLFILSFFRRNN